LRTREILVTSALIVQPTLTHSIYALAAEEMLQPGGSTEMNQATSSYLSDRELY